MKRLVLFAALLFAAMPFAAAQQMQALAEKAGISLELE